MKKNIAFILIFLFLLHSLRNFSNFYFLFVAVFVFLLFALSFYESNDDFGVVILFFSIAAYLYMSFFGLIFSPGDDVNALFRVWAGFPIVLAAFILQSNGIDKFCKALSAIYVLAAFSLIWQYIFGPISWFAEPSERAGGVRFSSLVGSLTAYGSAVGIAFVGSFLYFKGIKKVFFIILIFIGAVLSLQKSSILNIGISFVFLWYLGFIKKRYILLSLSLISVFFIAIMMIAPNEGMLGSAYHLIAGIVYSDSEISNDVTIAQSIIDRLTELPLEALNFHASTLVTGAGYFGGAGVFGYNDVPMAHNGIIEIICIFGYIFGFLINLIMLGYFIFCFKYLIELRTKSSKEIKFLCFSYILWFANNSMTGGGLFQPVMASIFWMILFRMVFVAKNRSLYEV